MPHTITTRDELDMPEADPKIQEDEDGSEKLPQITFNEAEFRRKAWLALAPLYGIECYRDWKTTFEFEEERDEETMKNVDDQDQKVAKAPPVDTRPKLKDDISDNDDKPNPPGFLVRVARILANDENKNFIEWRDSSIMVMDPEVSLCSLNLYLNDVLFYSSCG
jgi:hypothetical protein